MIADSPGRNAANCDANRIRRSEQGRMGRLAGRQAREKTPFSYGDSTQMANARAFWRRRRPPRVREALRPAAASLTDCRRVGATRCENLAVLYIKRTINDSVSGSMQAELSCSMPHAIRPAAPMARECRPPGPAD
jgi:hypothetical protein